MWDDSRKMVLNTSLYCLYYPATCPLPGPEGWKLHLPALQAKQQYKILDSWLAQSRFCSLPSAPRSGVAYQTQHCRAFLRHALSRAQGTDGEVQSPTQLLLSLRK